MKNVMIFLVGVVFGLATLTAVSPAPRSYVMASITAPPSVPLPPATPAKQYPNPDCRDGISAEVCAVINAVLYDTDNWKWNRHGANNVRLHVGIWLANTRRDVYFDTGNSDHVLDGRRVDLSATEQREVDRVGEEFKARLSEATRGEFKKFVGDRN